MGGMDEIAELVGSLPPGVVVVDPDGVEKYRYDWSRDTGAGTPVAVVRAENAEQVQVAVRWAARHLVAVVPRGAGSGLSGGSSAVDGGIVLSLERMRGVEIDLDCQIAVVEPGAFNAEVKAAAAEHGLWYPPDPSSYEICSIGGNVATNAGGLCCVKYGVTTDYVLGLDIVLADGTLVTLGGKRIKDVAGLSLVKLFVGSEGTLGIVTRAILRLVPAQAARSTLVAAFPTVDAAARAVVDVRRDLRPSMLELMDQASINAVEDYRPHGARPDDRRAAHRPVGRPRRGSRGRRSTPCAWSARPPARQRSSSPTIPTRASSSWPLGAWRSRRSRRAAPCCWRTSERRFRCCRTCWPRSPRSPLQYDVEIPVVAHAGDGNTHPIVVYDAGDADSERRARIAFDEVMQAAIALGGTITGEHGVGRTKKSALPDQLGPDVMALTHRIKDALDPDGILNPGAIL